MCQVKYTFDVKTGMRQDGKHLATIYARDAGRLSRFHFTGSGFERAGAIAYFVRHGNRTLRIGRLWDTAATKQPRPG